MASSGLPSDVLSRRWPPGGVDRLPVFVAADILTGPRVRPIPLVRLQ